MLLMSFVDETLAEAPSSTHSAPPEPPLRTVFPTKTELLQERKGSRENEEHQGTAAGVRWKESKEENLNETKNPKTRKPKLVGK